MGVGVNMRILAALDWLKCRAATGVCVGDSRHFTLAAVGEGKPRLPCTCACVFDSSCRCSSSPCTRPLTPSHSSLPRVFLTSSTLQCWQAARSSGSSIIEMQKRETSPHAAHTQFIHRALWDSRDHRSVFLFAPLFCLMRALEVWILKNTFRPNDGQSQMMDGTEEEVHSGFGWLALYLWLMSMGKKGLSVSPSFIYRKKPLGLSLDKH